MKCTSLFAAFIFAVLIADQAQAGAPLPGVFMPAGAMAQADDFPTATALPDGRVLVCDSTACQHFDPATNAWSAPTAMLNQHAEHTATALADGRVLIAGVGWITPGEPSAEIFNPATGQFTATGGMLTPRFSAVAVRLASGEVLVMGGYDANDGSTVLASAEIYSPTTGIFRATGAMATARIGFTATVLNDGRVLVAGGFLSGLYLANAEIYSPQTGTFTAVAGGMTQPRYQHAAALLADGRVLVAGGWSYYFTSMRPTASAEIFDPATGAFSALAASMTDSRESLMLTLLPSGLVLAAAGYDASNEVLDTAEVFDPSTATFTRLPTTLHAAVEAPATASLADGRVLVAGGSNGAGGYVVSADLFVPDRVFAGGFE
jgi:hypothetical protein